MIPPRVTIYGLFGTPNFGDELFSKVIVEAIRAGGSQAEVAVFTGDRAHTLRNVPAVRTVTGYPLPNRGWGEWLDGLRAIRDSDLLLFGGGGLFNEIFLRAGIPAYGIILGTARLFGVPYVIHGIEIGYVESATNRWITGWCLRNAERLYCRSERSYRRAREEYGADPVLGEDLNQAYLGAAMGVGADAWVGDECWVNLQHSVLTDDPFVDELLAAQTQPVQFLINKPSEREPLIRRFGIAPSQITLAETVEATMDTFGRGASFVTERFHFTMLALQSNRPTTVIISSSKVRDLLDRFADDKDVPHEILRAASDTEREVRYYPGSPAQGEVVARWAARSGDQLADTVALITDLRSSGARGPRLRPSVLPFLGACAVALVGFYVMDRYRPLNRSLQLKVT